MYTLLHILKSMFLCWWFSLPITPLFNDSIKRLVLAVIVKYCSVRGLSALIGRPVPEPPFWRLKSSNFRLHRASKCRSIFIKPLGLLLHGVCERTFCLGIFLVKQICSDAFLLSLSTPLAICPVKPSDGGGIYQSHLQYMSVHTAVSLGNKITISVSSLPYVILKIVSGCQ